MKNRFKIFTAILTATLTASTMTGITVSGYDDEMNDWGMKITHTTIDALSLDLKDYRDILNHTIQAKQIQIDCEISADADGYIYAIFSTLKPETIEDIEIPVSFFDKIENYSASPCFINVPYGYECVNTGTSGEIVDDGNCMEPWLQIVRTDDNVHKIDGEICAMRFAYTPMNVWRGYTEVPVMTYYDLAERRIFGSGDFNGNYFELCDEHDVYTDMPEINISFLKEMEQKINEYNAKIAELEKQIEVIKSTPNPDFNGDGRVSIADAVCLMKYISGVDSV